MGKKRRFFISALIIAGFFGLWETASRFYLVNPAFVPPFSRVTLNAYHMLREGGLSAHIRASLLRSFFGLGIGILLGIPLGFGLSSAYGKLKEILGTLTDVLAQLSPFLLFHIVILFLGIGEQSKISIIAWACLWPVAFNTAAGVDNIDRLILKAGRAFGSGRRELFFKVIFAASSPRIFTGIRISSGYALFMLVAAEMMGGRSGLGWLVQNYQVNFQLVNIFSIALIIALIGIAVDALMVFIQKRFIPYDIEEYINNSEA